MSASHPRRSLSLVTAILILTLIAGLAAAPAAAQTDPGQPPEVIATGWGRASAPATVADIQIIVSRGLYGGYSVIEEEIIVDEGVAVASPVAGWSPAMMDPYAGMMGGPMPLAEEDLARLTEVLVASGVVDENVDVLVPAFSSMYTGPGGPENAQIRFAMENPDAAALRDTLQALRVAAAESGLSIDHFGVRYGGADCAALLQEARNAAVEDARANAASLAEALGGELGALVLASDNSYFGYDTSGCAPVTPDSFGGPYGEGMLPPFQVEEPAEVVVYTQVALTYELLDAATATPTA